MATTTTALKGAGPVSGSRSFFAKLRDGDEIARVVTLVFATTVVLITAALVWELWVNSALPRQKFGFHFFVTSVWDPIMDQYGALPFIYGTMVTSAVALLIAVPLGIGAAIFLAELAPARVSDTLQFFIDLLAAVPSVIYGLLGVFIVVPLMRTVIFPALNKPFGYLPIFKGPSYGVGFMTAGIVLAIMVIPYIISVSREVLLSVPRDQREAALALGSTRWESTWKVVVPFAKTGIMGSIFLALARALGEHASRFHDHRFETAAAKLAAKLRDHAERTRMIAPLGDFDVGEVLGSRQHARRQIVIEIRLQGVALRRQAFA